MIQRRFRFCCAHCGYCLLCSPLLLLCYCSCCCCCCWRSMPVRPFVLLLLCGCCCCYCCWFGFCLQESNSESKFLLLHTKLTICLRCCCCCRRRFWQLLGLLLAAATAASTFNFRFEFSSSFLQLLHTTLISTQRCTNTQTHTHTYKGTHSTRTHTLALNSYVRDTNHHAYISICRRRQSPTCTLS